MKNAPYLLILLVFVFASCSKEELGETNDQNYVQEESGSRAPDVRVSVTGNQNFAVHARKLSNGSVSGFWRDNQLGNRVDVTCITTYPDAYGINAVLTGTVVSGPGEGMQFIVRLRDGQVDGISNTGISYADCVNANSTYLVPLPTQGQVKIQ